MLYSWVIKGSGVFFLLGLVLIAFLGNSAEPTPVLAGELGSYGGRIVRIEGELKSLSVGQHSFLKIDDGTAEADVVFFNRKIEASGRLCVVGKVSFHKGEVSVVGEKIC